MQVGGQWKHSRPRRWRRCRTCLHKPRGKTAASQGKAGVLAPKQCLSSPMVPTIRKLLSVSSAIFARHSSTVIGRTFPAPTNTQTLPEPFFPLKCRFVTPLCSLTPSPFCRLSFCSLIFLSLSCPLPAPLLSCSCRSPPFCPFSPFLLLALSTARTQCGGLSVVDCRGTWAPRVVVGSGESLNFDEPLMFLNRGPQKRVWAAGRHGDGFFGPRPRPR